MRTKHTLYTLGLLVASCLAFNASKWITTESKEFGYSVEFPAKPTAQQQTLDSEVGPLQMNMYVYDASNDNEDNLFYLSNCTEYPADKAEWESEEIKEGIYRAAIDGAVKNVQGDLREEKTVSMSGYEGREIVVGYMNGTAMISMRLVMVKNKMYMLQSICERKSFPNKSTSHFFESFKLKK